MRGIRGLFGKSIIMLAFIAVVVFAGGCEPAPPSVITNNATSVTGTSAILNGTLENLGTATSVTVSFEWGTSTSYGNETPASTMTAKGPFSMEITGLTPGTTYYFRAKAVGEGTSYGSGLSFTTTVMPPAITTNAPSSILNNSVILNGTLEDLGTASSVTVSFEWGTSTSYGNETTAQIMTSPGMFSANLNDLDSGTTYYFRVKAVGHGTVNANDMPFTTLR